MKRKLQLTKKLKTLGLLSLLLFGLNHYSNAQSLVKDINPGANNGSPIRIIEENGTIYFIADDGTTGYELWKSDGTAAGTSLIKDIYPGSDNSYPDLLTYVNGTLFFVADDGTNGKELWRSDGTAAGTVLVKDIWTGSVSSSPNQLTNVNGTLFFRASDGTNGAELWKSDGTAAGTILVKDIYSGATQSYPDDLVNFNGTLFFKAQNSTNGAELWKSDGTAAGTVLVKDINSGPGHGNIQDLTVINGVLFFKADNGSTGRELWKSDGTTAGTVLVKDIRTGSNSSIANFFTYANGIIFFRANDGTNGTELWKTDGTAAGTVMVKDINTGSGNSFPSSFTDVNGTLFFSADDGIAGRELWKSDGTAAGTVMVKDIRSGSGNSSATDFSKFNDTLFFSADDGSVGRELWKSDGTAAGTVLVKDINVGSGSSSPAYLTILNGTICFRADDGINGRELWSLANVAAPAPPCVPSLTVSTFAGSGTIGNADGTGTIATFSSPIGMAVDATGNIYVADNSNHKIRKITPTGIVTTFAGSGNRGNVDGTGTAASFSNPFGIAIDASGNLYVTDLLNHKIRKITATGIVTTFAGSGTSGNADGTGTMASFSSPYGVAVDGSGNVYVADNGNHKIRKITPAGVVTTFAGSGTAGSADGTGTAASFNVPYGLAVDGSDNVFVTDLNENKIRKITPAGVVTTFAGTGSAGNTNGTGTAASFNTPAGMAIDGSGNIYVSEFGNQIIRKITSAGVVTTYAGSGNAGNADGPGPSAEFEYPDGIAIDGNGNLYIAEQGNNKIRKISVTKCCGLDSDIPTTAGTYTASQTAKDGAWDCFCDANNKLLLALDTTGSGAEISPDSVHLFIGANPVVKYTNAGGIITNADGGIIMNRKWEVAPTTQPSSPVKVQFFFTNDEFTAVKDSLVGVGTTITSPSDLQIYKLNQNGFLSPHDASATGSLLNSGAIPSTTEWFHTALSANHSATFMVNSFSGGGGGTGANNSALPVDMLSFNAYHIAANTAQLDWTTASEHNNSHFVIERSFNGMSWSQAGTVAGKGNSNAVQAYNYTDANVNASFAYYRIKQVDINGEVEYTEVKKVNFAAAPQLGSVYPNPVQNTLNISIAQELSSPVNIVIYNNMGAKVAAYTSMSQSIAINMQSLANGIYTVNIANGTTTQVVKVVKAN